MSMVTGLDGNDAFNPNDADTVSRMSQMLAEQMRAQMGQTMAPETAAPIEPATTPTTPPAPAVVEEPPTPTQEAGSEPPTPASPAPAPASASAPGWGEPADTAAPPSPTPDEPAARITPEGIVLTGDESSGGEAAIVPPTSPPANLPSIDLNEFVTRAYGQSLPPEQVMGVFNFYDQVAAAPPVVQQSISALLAGDVDTLAQVLGPYLPAGKALPTPTPTPAATSPGTPDPMWDDLAGAVDPAVAARLAQIEARQNELLAAQQATLAAQQAAENARIEAGVTAGAQAFASRYSDVLDDTDIALLRRQVNQMPQLVNQRAQANGGDWAAAYADVLEVFAHSDQTTQAKLAARATAAVEQQAVADAQRKSKASALAGGGGSAVAPQTFAPPAPVTPTVTKRGSVNHAAQAQQMVEALRQMTTNG